MEEQMTKTVLTYGLISGGILAGLFGLMMPLLYCGNGPIDFEHSEIIGYTAMLLAFILVFLGIRSYREKSGGSITFGKAFQVGLFITLITCTVYVVSWEIVYWGFMPDFGARYSAHMIEKARKSGASAAAIEKTKTEMAHFQELYKNPFINVGMTFMEVFPIGLVMTLISAGILRRQQTTALT
jgi:hypothetical protein